MVKKTLLAFLVSAQLAYGSGVFGGSSGGGGSSAWGGITGTLSDQTDLQSALDGKLATGGNAATATALASNPTDCGAGEFATTIAASGNLTCSAVTGFVADPGTVTDTAIVTWSGTGGAAVTTNATHTIASTGAHTQTNSTGQFWVATGAAPALNTGAVDLSTTVGTGAGEYYGVYNTLTLPNNTTPTASIPFYATLTGAGANYNGAAYGMFINNDADVRGTAFSNGEQAGGVFHNTRTYNSVTSVAGFTHQSAGGAKNIGVHILNNGSSASGAQVGVAAKMASAGTGAASVGIWGVLDNDARGATLIDSVPSVSAAGLFDNGDFASAILLAQDNGTTRWGIYDGGAEAHGSTTIDLTADDQAVVVNATSYLRITSDNATASNRTMVLGDGVSNGQVLRLQWYEDTSTGAGELPDATANNVRLSAAWSPGQFDTLTLVWDSTDENWHETSRSDN